MQVVLVMLILLLAPPTRQGPNLSGTWVLDERASTIVHAAGLAGLGEGGTPAAVHITQAPNGNFLISSRVNGAEARYYQIGGETRVPGADGGRVTASTRWVDGRLAVEGGAGETSFRETYTLDSDGMTLSIEVVSPTAGGANTLVYRRAAPR